MRSPRLRAVLAAFVRGGRCTRLARPHASSITQGYPGVVARIPPMFESKVLRRPAGIMRQCFEAAMARINTSLTVACSPRRSRRENRDGAALLRRIPARPTGFRRGSGCNPSRQTAAYRNRCNPQDPAADVAWPGCRSRPPSPSATANSVEMRRFRAAGQPPVREAAVRSAAVSRTPAPGAGGREKAAGTGLSHGVQMLVRSAPDGSMKTPTGAEAASS